jgi:thymidylate synthase (FAD)
MNIIEPSFIIETPIAGNDGREMVSRIEKAARTCYKSEGCAGPDTASPFVRKLSQVKKHRSVLEHVSVTVRFVIDRGVSHELVRHRLAAFSQESTRYCNYGAEKFGREITVVRPLFWKEGDSKLHHWRQAMNAAESAYLQLLDSGASPQEARAVLPNSLKTEIVVSANLREWHHILSVRTSSSAHPQMRQVMLPLLAEFKTHLPEIFDDIP